MAQITITGNAVVITSAVKAEDIKKVAKYQPSALALKDEETKEEFFRVCYREGSNTLGKYGAEFGGVSRDGEGFACITLAFNAPADADVKELIADEFGAALLNLNKVEAQIPQAVQAIDAQKAQVLENIQVI